MNSELLIVSVGVEYPSLPSNVVSVRTVGFILTLKGQVFSLVFYNTTFTACLTVTHAVYGRFTRICEDRLKVYHGRDHYPLHLCK